MPSQSVWDRVRRTLFSLESVLYIGAVVLTVLCGWLVCSLWPQTNSPSALIIVELQGVLLLVAWTATTTSESSDSEISVPNLLLSTAVAVVPVALMFTRLGKSFPSIAFWIAVILWCAIGLQEVLTEESAAGWLTVLQTLGVLWTVSGVIITIGRLPFLDYARVATDPLHHIHLLLDLRILLGSVFFLLLIATAVVRALQERLPNLPALTSPRVRLPDISGSSVIEILLVPFVLVANVLLLVTTAIADVVLKVLTLLMVYLIRLGNHIGMVFIELVLKREAALIVGRLLASFVLVVLLSLVTMQSAKLTLAYVLSTQFWGGAVSLLKVSFWVGVVMVPGVVGLYATWSKQTSRLVQPTAFGLGMVVSILFFGGCILHILRRVDVLGLERYGPVGPFTVLVGVFLLTGFGTLLWRTFEPPRIVKGS